MGMSKRSLLEDFESLAGSSTALVSAWADRHAVLSGCQDLPAVLAAIPSDPDAVLAALLQEVAEGCRVAPRVVLRAMLPKMIVMARRDPTASLEDYLAHLWLRISTYPLNRRPRRIAANLALDTLKAVKADQAPLVVPVAELDDDRAWHEPTDDLSARRLLRAAVDLRLIDPTTHATMVNVYADGLPEAEVAARHRVTSTTVRRRCNRGIRVLAAHATRLAEAA
jgi:DNA-directed RNA polymerase specialized sigma24 family protein